MITVEIPFRLPSLNQYINECRRNRYAGAKMKKDVELMKRCPLFDNMDDRELVENAKKQIIDK